MTQPAYPIETLDEDSDDGTMTDSRAALEEAVVGQRITSVEHNVPVPDRYYGTTNGTIITLGSGKRVTLANTDDCCAYTELETFLLHADRIDHVITGVGTTDGYTKWHIYADMGDVLELSVGWSCGNPFYYGYGFHIAVLDAGEQPEKERPPRKPGSGGIPDVLVEEMVRVSLAAVPPGLRGPNWKARP